MYVFVYPIGIPLFMFLLMRAHNIPGMKRKKMGNGLVSTMIHDYMSATTSASSQRLASYLGMIRASNIMRPLTDFIDQKRHFSDEVRAAFANTVRAGFLTNLWYSRT